MMCGHPDKNCPQLLKINESIRIVQNQGKEGDHLDNGFEFAPAVGGDDQTFGRGDGSQPGHGQFSADDNKNQPGLHASQRDKHNESGGDQEFVS